MHAVGTQFICRYIKQTVMSKAKSLDQVKNVEQYQATTPPNDDQFHL